MTTRNPQRLSDKARTTTLRDARRMKYRATDLAVFGLVSE